VAEKVCVLLIDLVIEFGEIVKPAFTVTLASALAPRLSVTRIVTDPAVEGAVYAPVVAFITPPPDTIENINGLDPPIAEKVVELLIARVAAAGFIPKVFVIVTVESAV
jgi:hypothetical protein